MSIVPFQIDNSVIAEEEIYWEVWKLSFNRSRGPFWNEIRSPQSVSVRGPEGGGMGGYYGGGCSGDGYRDGYR